MPHSDRSAAVFATTHWSVVAAAGDGASPQAAQALEALCRLYWYPLYAYVRRSGRSPVDAQDLTQAFFERLLQRNLVARADRERGRFRTFLLSALKNFLAQEHERQAAQKRGGGLPVLPLVPAEAETHYVTEPADRLTPDRLFERRWALTVLGNALERLRQEYVTAGKGAWFDQLKDLVWGEKNPVGPPELARVFNCSSEALKKTVQRLRKQFREALRTEVGQTVLTVSEVDQEIRYLVEILRTP
jgi:RNA polymerase sigma-70 factor (ECF subfamily)